MIASNLLVNGAARFIQQAYFTDISVSGTASLASLSATGDITAGGNLYSTTGNLYLKNLLAINGQSDTWLRINANNAFTSGIYFGTSIVRTDGTLQVGSSGAYLKSNSTNTTIANLVAPTATITTGAITTLTASDVNANNVSVANNLHATHFDLQTVAQLGGSFYVSPTVKFPNSGTTLGVAKSGTTLTLTITDSSITSTTMAGIVWTANSRVKVSGTINGVVTGTMDGTVSSINTSSHVLTLSVSGENSGSVVAGTYSASQFSDLSVMVYQRRVDSSDFRVGIWMNCYDLVNSSATIRVYGGTSAAPNVLLGNLTSAGLGTVNGITPSGWGLYAQNAFLWGSIVSTEGQIGGWTIGSTKLYNNTDSLTSQAVGIYLGTDGIRNFASTSQYVNITGGKITALGVDVSGKITATSGAIGGFEINSTAIKTLNVAVTSNADNSISLSSADFTRTINSTSRAGLRFAIGDKFGVTGDGVIYAGSAIISGTLTAGADSKIGPWTVTATSIYKTNATMGNATAGAAYFGNDGLSITDKFKVSAAGAMTATSGSIAGWRIESTYLATGTATAPAANTLLLCPAGTVSSYTVAGKASSGWTITSGANFGVTKTGAIYANDAHLTGEITATSGYIGGTSGWTIASQQLSNGTLAADNSMYLATKNLGSNTTIAGRSGSDWRFTVGSNFGITNTGAAYASTLVIGPSNGYHATVADSAFKVYNNTTLLSSFGVTTQIGASTGNNIQINSNGITMSSPLSSPRIPEIFYIGVESRTANAGTQDNPSATEITTAPYYILGQSGYDSTTPQPGAYSFQSGAVSYATGKYSTAMGHNCVASGTYAFAVGNTSQATRYASVAIGDAVLSSGICSYAEGNGTTASGSSSHAEGKDTTASEWASHAEGNGTTASGRYSHAEGDGTVASGPTAHAEGSETTASGLASHAEGSHTIASGVDSHAEGSGTIASGWGSHASGDDTIASGTYQTVIGRCNAVTTTVSNGTTVYDAGDYAFIVGNGNSNSSRRNALTLDWDGNLVTAGSISTKYDGLIIYNENDKYGNIVSSAFTANRTFTLPDATGTIALTSSNITGTAGNVTGTVTVGHGGTGATSFTANSVIMSGSSTTAALTTRSITNNTSASAITASTNIITANTLAYWNGAYSGTTSRLAYCNQGAFGTMATKSAASYAALSGATFTGGISGTTGTFSGVVTAANIGNIQSASKSVAITSSNTIGATPAIGAQLTLTPGTYLLWGRFVFSTSGSGTTRNNRIAFYTGASPTDSTMLTESQVCVFTAGRNWGALTTTYIVSPTANTTYTVGGTSSLPGPDGGMSVIKAIRLL